MTFYNIFLWFLIYRKIIAYLENDGIRICSQRKKTFELEELKAVGELYSVIFFSRWLQGMTLKASSIGFVANRIASTIHATTLQLIILPRLIHLMLVNSRHDEAIYLLQEMGKKMDLLLFHLGVFFFLFWEC